MEKRPNPRAIVYWMRKPLLVAVGFAVALFLLVFLDRQSGLWGGNIAKFLGNEETVVLFGFFVVFAPMFIWSAIRWLTTVHTLTERNFTLSRGVLNRKRYVVSYESIQNINVDRSFLEVLAGLSTVRIETAGTAPGESEIEVEGLSAGGAEALVRELSARSGRAREAPAAGAPRDAGSAEDLREGQKRILAELREIRELILVEKRKKDWEAKKD